MNRRTRSLFVVPLVVALGAACDKAKEDQPYVPPPPTADKRPVDRLGPNELLPGDVKVLGLTLPRGMTVEHAFVDVAYASGAVPFEGMTEYVRARVRDGSFTKGEQSATFEQVKIPDVADADFRIRVERAPGGRVRLEIRNSTKPAAPALPDDEARLRDIGLTKQGKIINDSKHNE